MSRVHDEAGNVIETDATSKNGRTASSLIHWQEVLAYSTVALNNALIHVYDEAGNAIGTHEQADGFKEPSAGLNPKKCSLPSRHVYKLRLSENKYR